MAFSGTRGLLLVQADLIKAKMLAKKYFFPNPFYHKEARSLIAWGELLLFTFPSCCRTSSMVEFN